jgi:hypothetical protein
MHLTPPNKSFHLSTHTRSDKHSLASGRLAGAGGRMIPIDPVGEEEGKGKN